jgi:hypothetical protein
MNLAEDFKSIWTSFWEHGTFLSLEKIRAYQSPLGALNRRSWRSVIWPFHFQGWQHLTKLAPTAAR